MEAPKVDPLDIAEPTRAALSDSVIEYKVHELAQDVRELTVRMGRLDGSVPVLGQRIGANEDAVRRLEVAIDKMGDKFEAAVKDSLRDLRNSVLTWVTIGALMLGALIAILQLVVPQT